MMLIYCPCKNKAEAKNIAKELLKKRLIACANIIQSDSIYKWKGKIKNSKEAILIAKTNSAKAEKEIKKLHSYELPAIIKINAKANPEFEKWIKKS